MEQKLVRAEYTEAHPPVHSSVGVGRELPCAAALSTETMYHPGAHTATPQLVALVFALIGCAPARACSPRPDDVDVRCPGHGSDRLFQIDLLGVVQRLRQQPFDQLGMFPHLSDAMFVLVIGGPGHEFGQ